MFCILDICIILYNYTYTQLSYLALKVCHKSEEYEMVFTMTIAIKKFIFENKNFSIHDWVHKIHHSCDCQYLRLRRQST